VERNVPDKSGQSFKELACLYDISNLIEQLDNSLDIIFPGVINLIPPAFDFSELIVVKLTVSGREFFSDDFSQPAQLRTCALTVANEPVGELLVGYRPGLNFDVVETLLESRARMLELIAERLSRVIKQNQTEETLRLSEERFHLAVRGSNDGLWDRPDLKSDEEWWSPRWYELLGYQPDEVEPCHSAFMSWLHPDDKEGTQTAFNNH
jgi:PAS domain-containing protein